MIQKKICMVGDFAVGKTSLVQRFVKSLFSEKYLTTMGVKIDKKVLEVDAVEVMLILWDIEGVDIYNTLKTSYLRGASGYFLVADGTRRETFADAIALQARVEETVGTVPYLILLNKSDLTESWELSHADLRSLEEAGIVAISTSAKTGDGVELAFLTLAKNMIDRESCKGPLVSKDIQ
jgi:small GTP-binding protein